MTPKLEGYKHARRKGEILVILKSEYPNGVDFQVLRCVLSNLGFNLTSKELSGYLVYLENDGYIKLTRNKDKYILFAELENKGINLLDGFIIDYAILLG